MNTLSLVRKPKNQHDRPFELPVKLIEAIKQALEQGIPRSTVCKKAGISKKRFDDYMTLGERLLEARLDGRHEFTLYEQGLMYFARTVNEAEADYLKDLHTAVNGAVTGALKLPQGRFAAQILSVRDPENWAKTRVREVLVEPTTPLTGALGGTQRLTPDEAEKRRESVVKNRDEEIDSLMG